MAENDDIEMFDLGRRDLGELTRLTHAYFSELREYDIGIDFAEGWDAHYRRLMEGAMNSQNFFMRGLRVKGETVGFIMFGFREEPMWRIWRRGYLSNIYVLPSRRRRGLGTFMVDGALQTLRQMDVEMVELDVYVNNRAGRAFWGSFGFLPFKERLRLTLP